MKKWLLAFVLIAMLMSLYSCAEEKPANTDTGAASSSATDAGAADAAETPTAETNINKTEFVIFEDRICFLAKTSVEVQNMFADAANAFFRSLPDGVNKYLMIAPMRIAFEVPELQALSSDQKQEIRNIYTAMDSPVTLVDAYYALSQHAQNLNDIYYRTDHHWTHLGSYYAVQAFFEAAGIPYHKIGEYEKIDGGQFLGYLEDLANDPYFYDHPDTFNYYLLPGVNREAWVYYKNVETGELEKTVTAVLDENRAGYEKFIGRNGFSHAVIFGDAESGRGLLLVGNSYSFCTTTWFSDDFKTVILIDPRYFEGGRQGVEALIGEYGITDVLLLMSTSDSAALTAYFGNAIQLLAQ
jgi:hypothetical protein